MLPLDVYDGCMHGEYLYCAARSNACGISRPQQCFWQSAVARRRCTVTSLTSYALLLELQLRLLTVREATDAAATRPLYSVESAGVIAAYGRSCSQFNALWCYAGHRVAEAGRTR
jgi:hypothetical protein